MSHAGSALCLHAVTPAQPGGRASADALVLPGLDGGPVLAQPIGDFIAWVEAVDLAGFQGPGAARLGDLAWVAAAAGRLDACVRSLAAIDPVLPAPFAALFSGLEPLAGHIERHAAAISDFFHRTEDAEEWGVRVHAAESGGAPEVGGEAAVAAGAGPGARWLAARRLERDRAAAAAQSRDTALASWLSRLDHLAREWVERPLSVPAAGPSATSTQPLLAHRAYLVAREEAEAFVAAASPSPGLAPALTGPWPCYSFVPRFD